MLDQTLAQLMQRLLEKNAPTTQLGVTSRRLPEDLGIGRIQGKTIYLNARDHQEMRELLTARGYSLTPISLKDLSRSERLAAGTPNEKSGGGALKADRISIKALPQRTLNIAGQNLSLPDGCHVDANWHCFVNAVDHDALLLVENYEVFDQIHRARIVLPDEYANPLVIYRGDVHESRLDNVLTFLRDSTLPVIAFVDIDPRGLHIASTLMRLAGVLAPEPAELKDLLKSPATARHDLYSNQIAGVQSALMQEHPTSAIGKLWKMVHEHRSGIVQEWWLASQTTCTLW